MTADKLRAEIEAAVRRDLPLDKYVDNLVTVAQAHAEVKTRTCDADRETLRAERDRLAAEVKAVGSFGIAIGVFDPQVEASGTWILDEAKKQLEEARKEAERYRAERDAQLGASGECTTLKKQPAEPEHPDNALVDGMLARARTKTWTPIQSEPGRDWCDAWWQFVDEAHAVMREVAAELRRCSERYYRDIATGLAKRLEDAACTPAAKDGPNNCDDCTKQGKPSWAISCAQIVHNLLRERDDARAEAENLRATIIALDKGYLRADVLTLKLQQCPCRELYRCRDCEGTRDELETLTERRLELLTAAGVKEQCTAGEAVSVNV